MKAFLISVPMAFALTVAIFLGCMYIWEWISENTTYTEQQAGFFVLVVLLVLCVLFFWLWTYNNREVDND